MNVTDFYAEVHRYISVHESGSELVDALLPERVHHGAVLLRYRHGPSCRPDLE